MKAAAEQGNVFAEAFYGILLVKGRSPNQPLTDILAAHITETFQQEMRRQDLAA